MRGKHLRNLVGEQGYQKVRPYLERAFKGESVTFEMDMAYMTGRVMALEVTYTPYCRPPEAPLGVVVLVNDVTEKKKMERSLQASEARFRLFMEKSPMIAYIKDTSGRIVFMSNHVERVFGVKAEDWVGKTGDEFFSKEELKLLQSNDARILAGEEAVELLETLKGPLGPREFLALKFPFRDEEGRKFIGGFSLDITERRRTEAALIESEAKFRVLSEFVPGIVWTATPDGDIDYFNCRWFSFTGLTQEQTYKGRWLAVVHPDDCEKTTKILENGLASGQPFEMEYRLLGGDGAYRWFLCRASPIRGHDNTVERWLGMSTDIEAQKRELESMERLRTAAEAANAAKSAFLANMSHEIRTPLGVMIGFSELLKDETLDINDRRQFLDTIIRNGNELTRLIDDILDLSKVEAGRLEIERIPFSLSELIKDVMALFRPRIEHKGLFFNLTFAEGVPEQITSDPTRLRQVLINVIGNAVKFTTEGHIDVGVSIFTVSHDGIAKTMLCILVTDTGVGITEENKRQLFQPFSQGDAATTRQFGGTGLGLVLARRLARALGGDVVLKDCAPGVGSTFAITIDPNPCHGRHQADRASPGTAWSQGGEEMVQELQGVKVLVADDASDNQMLLKRILGKAGADVTAVDNGEDAVHAALQGGFDVILMDIQMPHVDGHDATRRLRRKGYRRPIIALTAHAMTSERGKSLAAGFDDHLTKPLDAGHLLATIKRYMKAPRRPASVL